MNTTNDAENHGPFATELHNALATLVDRIDAEPASVAPADPSTEHTSDSLLAAGWEHSRRRERTIRRKRFLAVVSALAVLGSGSSAAIMAKKNGEKKAEQEVRMTEQTMGSTDGVLVPDWTPDGISEFTLLMSSPDSSFGDEWVRVWGDGRGTIQLISNKGVLYGGALGLDAALASGPNHFRITGKVGSSFVDLSVSGIPDFSNEQLRELARSVILDANGYATLSNPPQPLKLVVDERISYPWTLSYFDGADEHGVVVTGVRTSGEPGTSRTGDRTVRGTKAWFDKAALFGAVGRPGPTLGWQENGYSYTVTAFSEDHAKRIAESLRPATQAEIERFTNNQYRPTPWRATPKPIRLVDDVDLSDAFGDGGKVLLRSGEVLTEKGCLNINVTFVKGTDELADPLEECVTITDDVVTWSTKRQVRGKLVYVALVTESVDATRIVSGDDVPASGQISEDVLNADYVSGNTIDLDKTGNMSKWIGVVALPITVDNPVLETFHNVARGSEPPADPSTTDVAHPNYDDELTNAEPAFLTPVSRTAIK